MHQMRLRQAKEKLHNEIHQTMKMYSSEKHQLLKQLANLRHDLTDLKLPEIASHTFDPYQTPRIEPTHYVHEKRKSQNDKKKLTSSKGSVVRCDDTSDYESDYEKSVSDTDQTIFGDNYDLYHDDKTDSFSHDDKSVSDLHSDGLGGHLNTQWYSGKYLRHSSLDRTSKSHSVQFKHDTPIYPEIFENEIPVIEVQDRQRCEIKLPTIKGINKKKVKFDGKTDVKLISPEQKMNLSRSNKTACNSQQRKWRPDRLTGIGDWKMKQAARGQMKGRNSPPGVSFPPIRCHREKKSLEAIPETLAESAEWKTLYLNIHDDDKRNKTLLDILHAVRIRMQTNERSLRFGEQRSSDKTDNILCDYLLGSHTRKERVCITYMNVFNNSHLQTSCTPFV